MAKAEIFTIGIDIPGAEFTYVPFHSRQSLLDADIIVFAPTLDYEIIYSNPEYQGLPNLSDSSSVQNRNSLKRWKKELLAAYDGGATIMILLRAPIEVIAATGETSYTGTGRSRTHIRHVGQINSYDSIPLTFSDYTISSGKKVKFTKEGEFLRPLWNDIKEISRYEMYFSLEKGKELIITNSGQKVVSKRLQGKSGQIILFPYIDFEDDDFSELDEDEQSWIWTPPAIKYGKIILGHLVNIHKANMDVVGGEVEPEWVTDPQYVIEREKAVLSELTEIEKQLVSLNMERSKLEEQLSDAKKYKYLLYGKGKRLEDSIINALQLFGFKADNYDDGESEFDFLIESDEGRFLGEAEGKDNSAINIKKLQQLERNIQEDYARDEVDDFAKGIMFGNPYRLTKIEERKEPFTAKVLQAAKRTGYSLITTSSMFPLVKYLEENNDEEFKKQIRQAIASGEGKIVEFPDPPVDK